jgi:hypothetical protein
MEDVVKGTRFVLACALSCLVPCAAGAGAEDAVFEFWPGARYDASVPSMRAVLGHEPGERISWHRDLNRYMNALAAAVPDQVRAFEYARSWEGRELIYVAVSSRENIARLEEIGAGMRELSDPRRTPAGRADDLIAGLPAPIWLSYGVHGNEISSPEAALLSAYHLVASRGDPVVQEILDGTIVFLVPSQNPDGRDRFVHHFEIAEGLQPDSSRLAAEHDEPWPGGRTNHYYFDLNRDWVALTQPEIRGQVAALRKWLPLVFVDLHEMGGDSTYFFAPEAVPYNPHLAQHQVDSLELFGRNNARWFDTFGFDYFAREVYDAFYPGYGASWPAYYGAIAMTYEQASTRGLVFRKNDGTDLHLREAVRHHFVSSISTAQTVARNREKFLRDFYDYGVTAIEEGRQGPIREYILPTERDPAAVQKLVGILVEAGVEVKRARRAFQAGGREYGAGTFVVPLNQPAKRLARVMLDVDVPMAEEFLEEQERRRKKKLGDQIYDVTAWSLPLMFNVDCIPHDGRAKGEFDPVGAERILPGELEGPDSKVACLVPWGTAAAGRLLTGALRKGLQVWTTDKSFRKGERSYPAGTLIFKFHENGSDLPRRLEALAKASGADVTCVDDSWVDEGANFGSGEVWKILPPRIALAWDSPTGSYSAGATRFVLERQFDYPVTPIRTRRLAGADLSRYQVLILPSTGWGDYASVLGKGGAERLKDWIRHGGTLIALGRASSYVASAAGGLLEIDQEERAKKKDEEKDTPGKKDKPGKKGKPGGQEAESPGKDVVAGRLIESEEDFDEMIQAEEELPDFMAGVLVSAEVDTEHWLGAGAAETVHALVSGREIYTPLKLDRGVNVARYRGADELLVSGYLWAENREQLAYKPFLVVQPEGRGFVIAFTADPTVRAYLDGLNVLLLNAVFRGAAHANPVR